MIGFYSFNKSTLVEYSMTKVLFVIESLSGGGAEKVLTVLLKHIDKTKFDVTLCPIVDTGCYVDEVKQYVRYKPIISSRLLNSKLGRLWYKIKYQLVYKILPMRLVYNLWVPKRNDVEVAFCEGFVTKLMSKSTNKKIAWVHIDLKYYPWTQSQKIFKSIQDEIKAYNKFDKIIGVSNTVSSSFAQLYGNAERIKTLYNPIDAEDIKLKANDIIPKLYKTTINLITVGRLVPQKGYDILINVIKRLKDDGLNIKLNILGDGEERNKLLSLIHDLELENDVKLLGFKSNPYPYIANSDIFVCSSRAEGYSLVIAESLVLGTPVISTYCSGPNELLDNGKYGMLVENTEDGRGLYEGIKKMAIDCKLRHNYAEKSRQRGKHFSINESIIQIKSILET